MRKKVECTKHAARHDPDCELCAREVITTEIDQLQRDLDLNRDRIAFVNKYCLSGARKAEEYLSNRRRRVIINEAKIMIMDKALSENDSSDIIIVAQRITGNHRMDDDESN